MPWEQRGMPLLLMGVALTAGAIAVVEFLVPLWAGAELGASPAVVGVLVGIQALAALAARPVAGRLADRGHRSDMAATGGVLVVAAMLLYGLSHAYATAGLAALLAGTGSALFWVPVRAHASDIGGSAKAYGRLFKFESRGGLVGFLTAFALLSFTGYDVVFLSAAASVLVAVLLLVLWREPPVPVRAPSEPRGLTGTMSPLVILVTVTAIAEGGLGLLLLLHLQRHFSLDPAQIGLVLGPGFVVFVLASGTTTPLTDRLGRARTLLLSLGSTGIMAVILAMATNTLVITVAWALAAFCIAAAVPVERAAVAAISGDRVGHGFGMYGAASLAGSLIAPALFGPLYGVVGWRAACLVSAALVCVSLPLVRWVVRPGLQTPMPHPHET